MTTGIKCADDIEMKRQAGWEYLSENKLNTLFIFKVYFNF